jgi:hypothetical protein
MDFHLFKKSEKNSFAPRRGTKYQLTDMYIRVGAMHLLFIVDSIHS